MPYFKSDDINLFYEDTGEGTPLLLFHGMTSNHAMFYREMDFFKKKYRVIALDSRGHGKSDKPEKYTLDDHVRDAVALINHLNLETLYVIGVSMGSYIAQGVAIALPERVKKLILVATKSYGEQSSMAELFDRHEDEFRGLSLVSKLDKSSQFIFHNQEKVDEWLRKTAERSDGLTGSEQAAASAALKDFDFRQELGKIQAETLVISGTYDGLNPPHKGRETAQLIPDATYMEFKRSGHAPNVEQDRLFLGITDNFLD
jgi:3-oxoadipate enol-lactonase